MFAGHPRLGFGSGAKFTLAFRVVLCFVFPLSLCSFGATRRITTLVTLFFVDRSHSTRDRKLLCWEPQPWINFLYNLRFYDADRCAGRWNLLTHKRLAFYGFLSAAETGKTASMSYDDIIESSSAFICEQLRALANVSRACSSRCQPEFCLFPSSSCRFVVSSVSRQ